jgi:hypothetical protein
MTEDDTKAIARIRFRTPFKEIAKITTYKAGHVTITVHDYGLEAGSERFWIAAESPTGYQTTESYKFRRMEEALEYISWEKL